jgi:hypothetical protein
LATRPACNLIDIEDPLQREAWAMWFEIDEAMLLHVVRLVGPIGRHIAEVLWRNEDPRR